MDIHFLKFFEKKWRTFRNDRLLIYTSLISLLLCACHIFQYVDSSFMSYPLIRACFCLAYPIIVYFAGRESIPFYFFVFGETLVFMNGSFINYTSFFIITLCCLWLPSKEKYFIATYWITTVAVCMMHDKSAAHLIIHFLNCAAFFLFAKLLMKERFLTKQLILTESERAILHEMRKGKQQKEINLFSKNTITKKLRDARIRNDIPTTEELLMRFTIQEQ